MGVSPRKINLKGSELKGNFLVKEMEWHSQLQEFKKERTIKNVAIIGAGFIGIEAAASIKSADKNINVHIIDPSNVPAERVLGKEIGEVIKKNLIKGGIETHFGEMT